MHWLRLLATSTQIETEIRRRLRDRFGISLPRFDYLAQLYRQPDGLKMKDLSRQLMVTGGNVTGLTDELEREGLVERVGSPTDRRSWIVRLTEPGRIGFQAMAATTPSGGPSTRNSNSGRWARSARSQATGSSCSL